MQLDCVKWLKGGKPLKKGMKKFKHYCEHVGRFWERSEANLSKAAKGEEKVNQNDLTDYDEICEMDHILHETIKMTKHI